MHWVLKTRTKACSIIIRWEQVTGKAIKARRVFDVTALIQGKVILCIAEFLWATGDEHIIIPEEIVETGHLQRGKSHFSFNWQHSDVAEAEGGSASLLLPPSHGNFFPQGWCPSHNFPGQVNPNRAI